MRSATTFKMTMALHYFFGVSASRSCYCLAFRVERTLTPSSSSILSRTSPVRQQRSTFLSSRAKSCRFHETSARSRAMAFLSFSSSTSSSVEAAATEAEEETQPQHRSRPPTFRVYYNDVYEVPLPPKHRFPMNKYRLVRERVQQQIKQQQLQHQEKNVHDIDFVLSPLATTDELLTTHEQDYVERFLNGHQSPHEQRNVGFPWSPQGVDRALSSVGGTLAAARYVCEHELQRTQQSFRKSAWAAHVAGGTHHAFFDYGEGFSVFSDMAVAANVVLQQYDHINNILLVDLDVHQGNGNAVLFQQTPNVFTFSMHCSGNYFSEKQDSDLDIELPIGCNDSTYLMTLHHWLKEFQKRHYNGDFPIDLVMFQAGVDVLDSDRLGRMSLSPAGVRRRNELVYRFVHDIDKPLVICMGGGYPKRVSNEGIDGDDDGWPEIIEAHANVYLQAYDFLSSK